MPKKLKAPQLVVTFAACSALCKLVVWLLAKMGLYISAAQQMTKWLMFFDLTPAGLIGGMIEGAVIAALMVYVFVLVYNRVGKTI
jgi:uncharacterized membrane protein (DUF441 family)